MPPEVQPSPHGKRKTDLPTFRFELAERLEGFADKACENDYVISGRVLSWRDVRNLSPQPNLFGFT